MIAELTEQGLPPESIASRLVVELRSSPQIRELILRELLTEEFLGLPRRIGRLETAVTEFRSDVNVRNVRMDGARCPDHGEAMVKLATAPSFRRLMRSTDDRVYLCGGDSGNCSWRFSAQLGEFVPAGQEQLDLDGDYDAYERAQRTGG